MNSDIRSWASIMEDPQKLKQYEEKVRQIDSMLGCFLSFQPGIKASAAISESKKASDVHLYHLPVAVKDNIAVKDMPLTCGSRILEHLKAPYTATAIEKLEQAGACIVGKTNLDEFGMGSSTENSALSRTFNPWDTGKVTGGSSGGSAAAAASGLVPLAIGSDTGGSVRQPANFCGVYGLKPTYGSISRYGLTAYASSLEVIGAMSHDLTLVKAAFEVMKGLDIRDQSSVSAVPKKPVSGQAAPKVAVLRVDSGALDFNVHQSYILARQSLENNGYALENVELPTMRYVIPAYYTIAAAEASANLARYNGMRYGKAPDHAETPQQLMKKVRHDGFGAEVKLRILIGTYVLRSGFQQQYYGQAQKVRTLIRQELSGLFEQFDIILMPVFPTQAFSCGGTDMDSYQQRLADVFTSLANLAGLPALALPTGQVHGLPTGVQLMAPPFSEERLFSAASDMAGDFPVQIPPNFLDIGTIQ